MLDVSIRLGILNLVRELKEREQIAFLYITHDLASAQIRRRRDPRDVPGPHRRARPDRRGAPVAAPRVHEAAAHGRAAPRGRARRELRGRGAPGRRRELAAHGWDPDVPTTLVEERPGPLRQARGDRRDEPSSRAGAVHAARRVRSRPRGDAPSGRRRSDTQGVELHDLLGREPREVRGAARRRSGSRRADGTRGSKTIENGLDELAARAPRARDATGSCWRGSRRPRPRVEERTRSSRASTQPPDAREDGRPPARLPQPRRRAPSTRRRSHRPRPAARARRRAAVPRDRPRLGVVRRRRAGRARRAGWRRACRSSTSRTSRRCRAAVRAGRRGRRRLRARPACDPRARRRMAARRAGRDERDRRSTRSAARSPPSTRHRRERSA